MEKIELEYYNKKNVWNNYNNNPVEINRAKKVISLIPKDVKSILDIGCGNGIITNMIEKPYVVGIDFAKIPLSRLKTDAIQASIDELPVKSAKFDLIILTEVLEHLNNETYNNAINEINRLNGKYLLITVPFNENVELSLCKCRDCGHLFNINHHYLKFNNKFHEVFPEYELINSEFDSYRIPISEKIVKLKHLCGVYLHSDNAICNRCGNPSTPPNLLLRYAFSALSLIDCFRNKLFQNRKPYHQMVLLKSKIEN